MSHHYLQRVCPKSEYTKFHTSTNESDLSSGTVYFCTKNKYHAFSTHLWSIKYDLWQGFIFRYLKDLQQRKTLTWNIKIMKDNNKKMVIFLVGINEKKFKEKKMFLNYKQTSHIKHMVSKKEINHIYMWINKNVSLCIICVIY